ncbi:aminotransferase class I/II-fold pyridoxal phosphate-dependent enzyme [Nocardia sp. NPDC127579]|uniref:aminotransferase class I/II-fold pyridoxal phosphate-dependent enzyme n=1 Tax=Nocardia sp. NPDC127579 TaxID=3345402 RepID=UPI003625E808
MDYSNWEFAKFAQGMRELGVDRPPFSDVMPGALQGVGDDKLINFAPVNFLNLQSREDVMDVIVETSRSLGIASGGSRISQGVSVAHSALEDAMAAYHKKEACVSFGSGALANLGFTQMMTANQMFNPMLTLDHSDVVMVFDRDAHWSLWKGVETLKYGERLFSFKHNDVEHLESILRDLAGKRVCVVFESVYSLDGTVAPMHDIVDVCEKYGALSYVDDANGFLIYGPSHRRFHREYEGMLRSSFIMVSMKKAVGVEGGVVCGTSDATIALEPGGTAMFTAGMSAPAAAATTYIMDLLANREPEIVDNYLRKVDLFRARLQAEGMPVYDTQTCFTSIEIGDEALAFEVYHAYLEKGLHLPVYAYPAAKRKKAVLRIIINEGHTDAHLEKFFDASREIRDKFNLGV